MRKPRIPKGFVQIYGGRYVHATKVPEYGHEEWAVVRAGSQWKAEFNHVRGGVTVYYHEYETTSTGGTQSKLYATPTAAIKGLASYVADQSAALRYRATRRSWTPGVDLGPIE